VEVYDGEGRAFDNFTSLHLQWHSSDQELLPLSYPQLRHHGNKGCLDKALFVASFFLKPAAIF